MINNANNSINWPINQLIELIEMIGYYGLLLELNVMIL
jgi:hypothetical protein